MTNDNTDIRNPSTPIFPLKQLSWTAIFVSALIGFSLNFLLNILGLALNLSLFNTTNTGAISLALGGMICIITGLIATMLTTGYIAGYLGQLYCAHRKFSIFYGLSTWSIILILNVLLVKPLNLYIISFTGPLFPADTIVFSATKDLNLDTIPFETRNPNSMSANLFSENSFIILMLFLVSAFSSCIGAFWGMSSRQENQVGF